MDPFRAQDYKCSNGRQERYVFKNAAVFKDLFPDDWDIVEPESGGVVGIAGEIIINVMPKTTWVGEVESLVSILNMHFTRIRAEDRDSLEGEKVRFLTCHKKREKGVVCAVCRNSPVSATITPLCGCRSCCEHCYGELRLLKKPICPSCDALLNF